MDGELDETQELELQTRIDRQPQLREQLQQLALLDVCVSRSFDDILTEPVPESIMASLQAQARARKTGSHSEAGNSVVSISQWRQKAIARLPWPVAVAASLVLALFLVGEQGTDIATNTEQQIALQLNTQTSGSDALLSSGESMRVWLTFKSTDGHYCREFTLQQDNSAQRQLACLTGASGSVSWEVLESSAEAVQLDQQFRAVTATDSLQQLVESMMMSAALGAEEEQQLIDSGWRD